jgi:uncharacterized Zn finger protein (UPF0148 family)
MSDRKCPNCGAGCAAGSDGAYACGACGGSFTFQAGEAKLTGVGELDRLRDTVKQHGEDLAEIKKSLPASRPGQQPPEDPSSVPDSPFDDDEDLDGDGDKDIDEDEDEEDL